MTQQLEEQIFSARSSRQNAITPVEKEDAIEADKEAIQKNNAASIPLTSEVVVSVKSSNDEYAKEDTTKGKLKSTRSSIASARVSRRASFAATS